jgi:trk system potassium uptake protein TrkA
MQGGQIDIAISPSYVTMSALLRFVRRGDVVIAHSLRRAAAEALELIVHGDARSSRVIGKTIDQIDMPRGTIIGAIVRGKGDQAQVLMAHHDVAIQAEDHLIVFVENKRLIPRVEKLFTVGAGFL